MDVSKVFGIIPPLITPLTSNLELDENALRQLIEYVIKGGVNGIFLLGSNGEGASLTFEVRRRLIIAALEIVDHRLPVYVNITTSSYLETLSLSKLASSEGADFLVLAPPFYFELDQTELIRFNELVALKSNIPLILYNVPQYTKTAIEIRTIKELAKNKNIIGIKDSSGNEDYVRNLVNGSGLKNFPTLIGSELVLGKLLLLGCHGGVCGGSNIFPKLYVNMFMAAKQKDLQRIKQYQVLIEKVQKVVYESSSSPISSIVGLKTVLAIKGICSSQMAMPIYDDLPKNLIKKLECLVDEFEEHNI